MTAIGAGMARAYGWRLKLPELPEACAISRILAACGTGRPETENDSGLRELHNLWFLKNIRRMSHTIAS